MTNLIQRSKGGNYYVVVNVPPRARHLFDGKKQVWKTTGTRDKLEAVKIGASILVDLKTKIATTSENIEHRVLSTLGDGPRDGQESPLLTPEAVNTALTRWRTAEIERCRIAVFNGLVPDGYEDNGLGLT